MVVLATPSWELERTRRTSGNPVSATSIGMAIAVSSSSAPIDAFWTMTLKTGAERSGKTSRRRSFNHKAPMTEPASARSSATTGFAKELVMMRSMIMVVASAFGLLGLGFQKERTVDHDGLAWQQSREHLHFTLQIASAPDSADLERASAPRNEDHPMIPNALQRRDRD